MWLPFLFVALLLLTASCAVAPPVAIGTPYDSAEHASYLKAGNGTIKGQGFLRQRGGGVVTCAGSPVLLFPATSYFREAVQIARTGRAIAPESHVPEQLKKQTKCDAQGNFEFTNIAAGNWFITTEVNWVAGRNSQGGVLMSEVLVAGNQIQQVILTETNRVRLY